ncbi:MAG: cytochrome c maturation protein CcmE [Alphaproteobacteria bacterium]|nr:cytochrome c maturation protein CcmE [Alphaproteobacteria bacterium]
MSEASSVDGRRRRLFLGLTLLVGSAVLAFIAFGDMGENLVYFWEPTQLVEAGDDAYGAQIRLGGLVKEGTLQWDEASQELRLVVTDGQHEVKVHATGAPPQMLREGIGVVVEGTMVKSGPGGTFETDRLMVKHSNEYRAPQEGVDPKELYKTLEENVN